MQEYVSTIIYICIFCIILELILPENKLKKYVGVLISLVIILTLISPIINILDENSVIQAISSSIESIQTNVSSNKYNFSNIENKLIFSSVKKDLEQEILNKCKEKFGTRFNVQSVVILLKENYELEDINIYIENLPEIAMAGNIIDFVSNEYEINASLINVIGEE